MLTESEARDLLDKAAATIDVPIGGQSVPGRVRRRGLPRPVVAACVVAVAAAVVAFGVLVGRTEQPEAGSGARPGTSPGAGATVEGSSPGTTPARGGLTPQQIADAVRIARSEIARQRSDIRVAVAQLHPGTVHQSNTGHTCDTGTLLRVTLIGSFPHTDVAPAPGPGAVLTVHAEVIEANPDNGQMCLIGVQTGRITVPPGATRLPQVVR